MKRVSLEQLLKGRSAAPYEEQYRFLMALLAEGRIKPLKSAGTNGKRPALHLEYWLSEEAPDYAAYREELLYRTMQRLSVDCYLRHLAVAELRQGAR